MLDLLEYPYIVFVRWGFANAGIIWLNEQGLSRNDDFIVLRFNPETRFMFARKHQAMMFKLWLPIDAVV